MLKNLQIIWVGENSQTVTFLFSIFFLALLRPTVWLFRLFSTVLKRFCPGHSKNVFVLVSAHLEPELELYEVYDIGEDGEIDPYRTNTFQKGVPLVITHQRYPLTPHFDQKPISPFQ